jgi:hypothetical protein
MARQREAKLVGTIGNVIFYNREGEYYMRAKPVNVRRTEASVHSGLNFGKASKISKQIRSLIDEINPSKSNIQAYRLNAALHKFISWKEKKDAAFVTMPKKLPFIYGFQFNDKADLSSIHSIQPNVIVSVPQLIEINFLPFVPGQNLQAPANTNNITFNMILLGVNLNEAETIVLGKAETNIPYSNESFQPPVISISASPKPGDLLTLVIAVQYMVNKNGEVDMVTDKKKLPCGVAWAAYN